MSRRYINNENEFAFFQTKEKEVYFNNYGSTLIQYLHSNNRNGYVTDQVSIAINKAHIIYNEKIILTSNVIGIRYDVGSTGFTTVYTIDLKEINGNDLKIEYHSAGTDFAGLVMQGINTNEFRQIWDMILNAVYKFIVPLVIGKIMSDLILKGVSKIGNLVFTVEGVIMNRKLLYVEKKTIVPWSSILIERDSRSYKIKSSQFLKVDTVYLSLSDWNVVLLPDIKNHILNLNHKLFY